MEQNRLVVALDWILEGVLFALLAWLPFAFGGVEPLSHLVLVCGVAVMALCFGLRSLLSRQGLAWHWAYVPMSLFLGLVAVQGLPGVGVGGENLRLWTELLGRPPLQAGMPAVTLSLDPAATKIDLRLLLALAALFVVLAHVLQKKGALRRLLVCVSVVGAVLAAQAVLQTLSGTDKLLWLWKSPGGVATSGPFVHYGHFSQCLNLCLGCGLALLLWRLHEREQRERYRVEDLVADLGHPGRRFDLFLLAFLVVGIVAISLSRSRNGLISMAVAGAVVAALLQWTKFLRGMGWWLAGLCSLAFLALLFVGFDPVYYRMATVDDPGAMEGRLAIAKDALQAVRQFPWFGSGQGSFASVFPMFDGSERGGRAAHAENQYLEVLVETGAIGLSLAVAFAATVAWPWIGRLWRRRSGSDGLLFGLLFGAIAVCFHASTDFGLRIPAVAVMVTVVLAAATARVGRPAGGRWPLATGFGVVAAGLLAWQLPALLQAHQGYRHWQAAETLESAAEQATDLDTVLRVRMAQRSEMEQAIEAVPDQVDWQVRYAAVAWKSVVAAEGIDLIDAKTPLAEEQVARMRAAAQLIQTALLEARRLCPVDGALWAFAGQLGVEWLGDDGAAAWIHRGYAMAKQNPAVCVAMARQLVKEGDAQGAAAVFRRAIVVGGSYSRVLGGVLVELGRADVARETARGNARWLVWLEQKLKALGGEEELAAEVRSEARGLIEVEMGKSGGAAWMLAAMAGFAVQDGDRVGAIGWYRRYLALVPESPSRLQLARLLKDEGEVDAARSEARRLLNYQPGNAAAKRLLEELR